MVARHAVAVVTGGALRETAAGRGDVAPVVHCSPAAPTAFARGLGNDLAGGEPRATHLRPKRRIRNGYACRQSSIRTGAIEVWLAPNRRLTALAIVRPARQIAIPNVRRGAAFDRAASAANLAQDYLAETDRGGGRDTPTSRSRPGLWTARAMEGPTRPQPLFLFQPSLLILRRRLTAPAW